MHEETVDRVTAVVSSVLAAYHEGIDGRRFGGESLFNDQCAIAGEDAEIVWRGIAAGLGLDEEAFFERMDMRVYFERDFGLALLPLALIAGIFRKGRRRGEIEAITVREFARRVVDAFGAELADGRAQTGGKASANGKA